MQPKKKSHRLCVDCGCKVVNAKEGRCLKCYQVWFANEIRKKNKWPR